VLREGDFDIGVTEGLIYGHIGSVPQWQVRVNAIEVDTQFEVQTTVSKTFKYDDRGGISEYLGV